MTPTAAQVALLGCGSVIIRGVNNVFVFTICYVCIYHASLKPVDVSIDRTIDMVMKALSLER